MITCLQKCKESFVFMKTLVLTPTCTNKTSNQNRGFIQPPLHPWGGNQTSVGGFYFGIYAPIGAIQPKEVAIAKEGSTLHCFKVAYQFLSKGKIS